MKRHKTSYKTCCLKIVRKHFPYLGSKRLRISFERFFSPVTDGPSFEQGIIQVYDNIYLFPYLFTYSGKVRTEDDGRPVPGDVVTLKVRGTRLGATR